MKSYLRSKRDTCAEAGPAWGRAGVAAWGIAAWRTPARARGVRRALHVVARPHDARALEARDGADQALLHLGREGAGDAVWIDHVGREALGLQPDHVRAALGEAGDLGVDRGAVARAHSRLGTASLVGGERVLRRGDEFVRPRIGARLVAGGECRRDGRGAERVGLREEDRRVLRRLRHDLGVGPVDGRAVEARWRACLEPRERQPEPVERERDPDGRRLDLVALRLAHEPARRPALAADVHRAAQEGARGEHHRPAPQLLARRSEHALHAAALA